MSQLLPRREVLRRLGGSAAALTVLPALQACHGVVRASPDEARDTDATDIPRELATMLYYASLAPSGHNTQPWRVRVLAPDRLIVGVDPARLLPAVDPTGRELMLSIGAFLENMAQAAATVGRGFEYRVLAETRLAGDIAEVRLPPIADGAFSSNGAMERMRRRRVLRNVQGNGALRAADVAALLAAAGDRATFYPRGSPQATYLADGSVEANRLQASRDPAQEELARWIRWRDADGRRFRDGLTPESMEIAGIAGMYVRHFYSPETVVGSAFRKQTVDNAARQAAAGGGWLVIASPDDQVTTLLETGRRFERLFLGLRERRIALHPMTQMLEEAPLNAAVGSHLALDGAPQFLLRIGYVTRYPEAVSLRRPVRWFTRLQTPNRV